MSVLFFMPEKNSPWGYIPPDSSSEQDLNLAQQKRLMDLLLQANEDAWRYVTDEILRPYVQRPHTLLLLQQYSIHPDAVISRVYLNLTRNNANALHRFRFDCRLSTYLWYWIKDAVQAEVRSLGGFVNDFQTLFAPDLITAKETPCSTILIREKMAETEVCLQRLYREHLLQFCVLVCRTILHKSSKDTAELMNRTITWVDQNFHRSQINMRSYRKGLRKRTDSSLSYTNIQSTKIKNHSISKTAMDQKIKWSTPPIHNRRTCMLMITHSCNLNCTYCYESHKSNRFMSSKMAKSAILKEVQTVKNSDRYDALEIDFMGGEPMTNFELIKDVVEWAETGAIDVPHIFFLTSNGTLFNEERKAWFEKRRDHIVVSISYDGTIEMQNRNRNTKNYNVDREWFHRTWPDQDFHMTISQETLPHLAEGILTLQRKGYYLSAALAQGIEWTEHDAEVYDKQLQILSESYLSEPQLPPINLIGSRLYVYPTPEIQEMQQKKWCGSGDAMITYDLDGTSSGCHMFTRIVLGNDALNLSSSADLCKDACEDDFCRKCVLKLVCPTCAGFNYRYRGDIAKRDHRWCHMVLAQARKAAEFQIKALATLTNDLDSQEVSLAESALKAFAVFQQLENQNAPFISK